MVTVKIFEEDNLLMEFEIPKSIVTMLSFLQLYLKLRKAKGELEDAMSSVEEEKEE